MLVLIMTVCALAAPARCHEARLQFAQEVSPMQCIMGAQPYIAQWASEHPDMRVARWRCGYPDREPHGA